MPGDFLPRREACQITTSPIFLMGPELETTGVKLRLHNVTLQITPLCTPGLGLWTLDATKSLIYNISLMAGQTGGYDLRVQGLYRQMTRPAWKMVHRDVNRTCDSGPNGKESRSFG
jgi:hypothetical protein